MNLKSCNLLIFLSFLTSCSMFEHRQFFNEMEYSDEGFAVAGQDFEVVPGDSGIAHRSYEDTLKRTPASKEERKESRFYYSLEDELERLESKQPPEYYTHYLKYQDYLPSTSQRIYFLRLRNLRERNAYLDAFGSARYKQDAMVTYRNERRAPAAASTGSSELSLGMSKTEVENLLGRPGNREIAGGDTSGNERWTYGNGGSNSYVYFSNGQVQGWYD